MRTMWFAGRKDRANVLAVSRRYQDHHVRLPGSSPRKMTMKLKSFWRYYGGKYRAAPRYPAPVYPVIIEPFAGSAGYATRYYDRHVILYEKYPIIAEMWRWLIRVSPAEVRAIPYVEHVDDLPAWVSAGGRYLVGFWLNTATVSPRKSLSAGRKKLAAAGRKFEGWTDATKERIASQVSFIRHWQIVEGDYSSAPDVAATWFIDPPYSSTAGSYYVHNSLDFETLGAWCRTRRGQAIVCENEGATWLPFREFATLKAGVNGKGSREVIWP